MFLAAVIYECRVLDILAMVEGLKNSSVEEEVGPWAFRELESSPRVLKSESSLRTL